MYLHACAYMSVDMFVSVQIFACLYASNVHACSYVSVNICVSVKNMYVGMCLNSIVSVQICAYACANVFTNVCLQISL